MSLIPRRLASTLAAGILASATILAHGPTLDSELDDWCVSTAPRIEDAAANLSCAFGQEQVWWDAPADAPHNDLAILATTQDPSGLFWGLELHESPDPGLMPFMEIAIDVGPGGLDEWWDPAGALRAPGHCSVDTSRRCAQNEDCHFCAISTVYTGTPNEQSKICSPRAPTCSSEPADVCLADQTCEGLTSSTLVPSAGVFSDPEALPDYLLVLDFGRWLFGLCDSVNVLRNDGGTWVEIPRQVPDPACPLATWKSTLAPIGPCGNCGGPPAQAELAVPWEAFDCDGCLPFGPGDDFRWTVEINRTLLSLDYIPRGPIEDVMSEAVAGTSTTTTQSCPGPGPSSTLCEIADGSTDAFVPPSGPGAGGGRVVELTLNRADEDETTPALALSWTPSCSVADDDYAIYEGEIGSWYDHEIAGSGTLCTTGGATSSTFDADSGDRYYLVVPRTAFVEGSYGRNSDGTERPGSTAPCIAQSVGSCPGS